MPKVSLLKVNDVEDTVRKGIDLIGGIDVDQGDQIVIKPNVAYHKDLYGNINTDLRVLDAVIRVAKEHSNNVLVVETDSTSNPAEIRMEQSGTMGIVRKNDVSFLNLSNDEIVEVEIKNGRIRLPKTVLDAPYFINVPKLKTHELTVITVALKNLYGLLPEKSKAAFYHPILEEIIPLINLAVKQDLIVVDGIIGMEGRGPIVGTPVEMNVILCGRDPVTVDSVAAYIMGFKPEKIKTIIRTHQGGIGEIDLSKIEIVGEKPKSVTKKFRGPEISIMGIAKDGTTTLRILFLPSKSTRIPGVKEVGIGVIGAGKIAELLHFPGYSKLENVRLVAVADPNEERLLEIQKKFIIREVYTDYHDLLANKKIDAVSICTPPELHKIMTIEALENRKHVLCEKPLATSSDDCYEVIEALNGTKKFVMPAFNYRFTPSVRLANEIISRGKLGDLKEIKVLFKSDQRTWKSVTPFRFKEKTGVISDLGPHSIDMLRFLCGEIEKVKEAEAIAERYFVYDNADLTFTMENGASANIELSWFGDSIIPSFPWEIKGKKASLKLDILRSPFSVKLRRKGEKRERKYALEPIFTTLMSLLTAAVRRTHVSYFAEIDYFVQCVANNARPQVTVQDGARCVEVMEEIAKKL
ncbi:MAG: DUF362 domain-containing protein [Candidatus Jordarchaeum sp.]|uniref:DUF362 domain-containing protein n=1 Tax=Candidatus Jordarchaeum sp. TaxID=2823881 RepID=UPI00404B5EE7